MPTLKICNIIYNDKQISFTIQPSDVTTYNKILENFHNDAFPGNDNITVYVPAQIKQIIETEKVVFVKNVDYDLEIDAVKQSLSQADFSFTTVERLKRQGQNTKIVKITLTDKLNREILIQTGLRVGYCLLKCEAAKHNNPLQCRNCLKFDHPKKYCKQSYQSCAKCADHHSTENCTTTQLKCVNYEDDHASNSNACLSFIEQRQKLQKTIDEYTTPLKA
ncbi:unnamed protein product [Didymodactylos carnosus]|uniref:Gag-like protein n=1 Tax=Didymodactylos carnosus TaxID=1234261 RepID=A0A813W3L5_9BILA|nr:unnamed protein product [Didymodactylos carnosus]CAF3634262.1 unnamed protein product [Didymodactylos carnosus]